MEFEELKKILKRLYKDHIRYHLNKIFLYDKRPQNARLEK